jgi:hypothetical protein
VVSAAAPCRQSESAASPWFLVTFGFGKLKLSTAQSELRRSRDASLFLLIADPLLCQGPGNECGGPTELDRQKDDIFVSVILSLPSSRYLDLLVALAADDLHHRLSGGATAGRLSFVTP